MQEFCESDQAFENGSLFSGGLDFGQIVVRRFRRRAGCGVCCLASKKLPQVTVSRVVQAFCESDCPFAILFNGGLDFGQIYDAGALPSPSWSCHVLCGELESFHRSGKEYSARISLIRPRLPLQTAARLNRLWKSYSD